MPDTTRTWDGGYIRKDAKGRDVFIIRRMLEGHRFEVSTRCHTSTAAHAQLKRFEEDPWNYRPGASQESTGAALTKDTAALFLSWSRDVKKNTPKWVTDQHRALVWWLDVLGEVDVRRLSTARLVSALDGAPEARKQKIATLKAFCSWLIKERHVLKKAEDPTAGLSVPQARPEQWKTPKAISPENFAKVREHLEGTWRDALDVLAGTGWHFSELARFITGGSVSNHPTERGAKVLDCPQTKSGEPLRTQVSPEVVEAAARLLKLEGLNYFDLRKALAKASSAAGVRPALQPGHLRHSVATWAVNSQTPPAVVSAFLNHKSPQTTKRFYATFGVPAKVPTLR
jgi:integrase